MRTQVMLYLSLSLMLIAKMAFADCKEYKIVDYGDRVEAICVGEPLTDAQKREFEKQVTQEQKASQEIDRRKTENNDSHNTYQGAVSNQRNPAQATIRTEVPDAGNIVIESYDIKYIPSNRPIRNGRPYPGEYSVKIVAKNNGRQGNVNFKLKQTDFSGFETESISFGDYFEKDQHKTVTTHLPAQQVPFIQSSDWIIEAIKR